ncbi:MAG: hypothetical protein JWQ11_1991 [Rhizobacter sp.]|nr:hypothetical protein [Rhizobacter sp.]
MELTTIEPRGHALGVTFVTRTGEVPLRRWQLPRVSGAFLAPSGALWRVSGLLSSPCSARLRMTTLRFALLGPHPVAQI